MPEIIKKVWVDLIVFDLDGTLADSLPDLVRAANHSLRRLRLPERGPDEVKGMIGGGERKFMERLVGPDHQDRVEDCLALYLDYYSQHSGDRTRVYPGVEETLQRLSPKKLAVLSNKLQRLTEQVLESLGLARYFQASRGGGSNLPLKPAPEALTAIITALMVAPERTLMVGDKPADISCARGAGAHIAAVTYGYGEKADLEAAHPDFLLDRFGQIADIVD